MIFTIEKVLYWAMQKDKSGGFNAMEKEFRYGNDLAVILNICISNKHLVETHRENRKRYYKITELGKIELARLQEQYKNKKQNKNQNKESKSFGSFLDEEPKLDRKCYVYSGSHKVTGELLYIGTTIQKPTARFRWHKANGKDLNFKVLHEFDSTDDMLAKEFELIQIHKPKLNKITNRKQNLNVRLTTQQLNSRKGDSEWCQCCLKRRAKVKNKCSYC